MYLYFLFIIQGCGTKGGPDANKPCVFPFQDREKIHSKCTSGTTDRQPWCPTEVDQNGYYIDGKWGYCDSNCETGNGFFFHLGCVFVSLFNPKESGLFGQLNTRGGIYSFCET